MFKYSRFLALALVLAMLPTSASIDPNHPLSQYLKSLHRRAGKDTIKTKDHPDIEDLRKRFEEYRRARLEQVTQEE